MSRHKVIWVPSADNELAEIWLNSIDRDEVALASSKIDTVLGDHAESVAEEVAEQLYGFDCPPLRVLFEVIAEGLTVRILKVKRV